MPKKLNRKQNHFIKLLDEFTEDAKHWGWEQDQGVGKSVDNAEEAFNDSKKALIKYVNTKLK